METIGCGRLGEVSRPQLLLVKAEISCIIVSEMLPSHRQNASLERKTCSKDVEGDDDAFGNMV